MKIHTFRLKRDEVGIENKLENKYPLYAFTRDKKIAARFMRERDQKDFIYIQITKDKEEFDSWAAHNRAVQLDVYPIETYTHKNTNKQDIRYVSILATEGEMDILMENIETCSIAYRMIANPISPTIFTEPVYNSLKMLGYVDLNRFCETMTVIQNPSGMIIEGPDDTDLGFIAGIPITFDQLGCWVILYGRMLTGEFYKNLEYKDEC